MQVYKNFIGGEFVESKGSKRILNTNPADTRDVLGEVILSTKEEAAVAVDAAAKAFKSWKRMPAP
jgi:acyl-CoA reductase-like NAD-dependent aldehyde dehydrogenase